MEPEHVERPRRSYLDGGQPLYSGTIALEIALASRSDSGHPLATALCGWLGIGTELAGLAKSTSVDDSAGVRRVVEELQGMKLPASTIERVACGNYSRAPKDVFKAQALRMAKRRIRCWPGISA